MTKSHAIDAGQAGQRVHVVIGITIGLILISLLFATPRPASSTAQPWKVELLTVIFLIAFAVWSFTRGGSPRERVFDLPPRTTWKMIAFLSLFTLWSGASMAWAPFALLSVHHTLIWAIYLIVLALALNACRTGRGLRVI